MDQQNARLNLYAYRDFREFLRDFCHIQKKQHGNRYSYRNLGRQAGFHSPNYLLLIIQGHRKLPDDKILCLAHLLKLDDRQSQFFKSLVIYTQETDPSKKAAYLKQLAKFDESGLTQDVAKNTATYLSHWYHPTVREMVKLADFKPDPEWIVHHISPPISIKQAQTSLKLLQDLGLVHVGARGKWTQTAAQVISTQKTRPKNITRYFKSMIHLGENSLKLPGADRKVTAMTMSLSRSRHQKILKKIEAFKTEIQSLVTEMSEANTPNEPIETVYQLNLNFFKTAGESIS